MEKNLFGLESHDRPLGNRFLHATVVLVDDQFMSTITVEEENAVVYRRELRFASLEQAHTDLNAQLRVMDEVPLEDLMNLEAHEEFRWDDHRRLSVAARQVTLNQLGSTLEGELLENYVGLIDMDKPLTVVSLSAAQIAGLRAPDGSPLAQAYKTSDRSQQRLVKQYMRKNLSGEIIVVSGNEVVDGFHRAMAAILSKQALQAVDLDELSIEGAAQDGEYDTHVDESIGDVQPKSHYLSRRALKLEHYSYRPKVMQADPSFYGQGFRGEERKRKMNDPATWINRTYYYDAGTKPEAEFEGKYKYTAEIPDDKVYDVGADPQGIVPLARREGGVGTDMNILEQKIKEAGYFGYRNTRSPMPNVVAVFVSLPLTPAEGAA